MTLVMRLRGCARQQILAEELNCGEKLEVSVFLFRKTVPFILRHQIPDRPPILTNGFNHLFRLAKGNTGIVFALDHQKRFGDLERMIRAKGIDDQAGN